jgi:hypothetical protein
MEWYLRPIDWYLTATDFIAKNPQWTFWVGGMLFVLALVF